MTATLMKAMIGGREAELEIGRMERRAREGSIVEWPGRRPPSISKQSATQSDIDCLSAWKASARQLLIEAARSYRAVVYFGDLAELVEAKSGVDGRGRLHWMRHTLLLVAEECYESGEPLLSVLCIDNDRSPAISASQVDRITGNIQEDFKSWSADERLRCYRHYGAADLPTNGGDPVDADACLPTRPSQREVVRKDILSAQSERREAGKSRFEKERRRKDDRRRQKLAQHRRAEVERCRTVASPGSLLTVYFGGDESDTETFLLADRRLVAKVNVEVVSLDSPLGRAILEAGVGETREYTTEARKDTKGAMRVTLVSTEPFDSYPF